MRRRDLLKLAAAAPLGFLGRRSPAPAEPTPPPAIDGVHTLTLRCSPIIAPLFMTPELLDDVRFEWAKYLETRMAMEFFVR